MTTATAADKAILATYGHPEGPIFGFGPRSVECRHYDEHRHQFNRQDGQWHCNECHEDDYKHRCTDGLRESER